MTQSTNLLRVVGVDSREVLWPAYYTTANVTPSAGFFLKKVFFLFEATFPTTFQVMPSTAKIKQLVYFFTFFQTDYKKKKSLYFSLIFQVQ